MRDARTNRSQDSQTKLVTIHHDVEHDIYQLQIGDARSGYNLTIAQLEAIRDEIERVLKELAA